MIDEKVKQDKDFNSQLIVLNYSLKSSIINEAGHTVWHEVLAQIA